MSPLPRRPWQALLLLLLTPLACDAFSPPDDFPPPIEPPPAPLPFCPSTHFARATPSAALVGPLFAWLTPSERELIEAGGALLPEIPAVQTTVQDRLVAKVHDALPGAISTSVRNHLYGQPRVGRSFWTFAFSAPRASVEHDQLVAIWLRPDAWFASYAPDDFPVVDATGTSIPTSQAALAPGRIAGVDTRLIADCLREGSIERTFAVFREEAIDHWRFGPEAEDQLDQEVALLEAVLQQLRSESELNPTGAFSGVSCGASLSPGLCPTDTYFQAIPWASRTYLPTIGALAALIDDLAALPGTAPAGTELNGADDLAAWTAVWPGPWLSPGTGGLGGGSGLGGAGGLGGSGG